jgi:hypothetical protein
MRHRGIWFCCTYSILDVLMTCRWKLILWFTSEQRSTVRFIALDSLIVDLMLP